jgi:alpha-galactosidase
MNWSTAPDITAQAAAERPEGTFVNGTIESFRRIGRARFPYVRTGAEAGSNRSPQIQYNDTDSGITYSGTWSLSDNRGYGDYNNDVHFSQTNNDYFQFTFTGTGIDYITEKDFSQGDVDIYVDNVFKMTVSTYNASRLAGEAVYSITGLASGSHTFKAVKKTGTYMLLDSLRVTS